MRKQTPVLDKKEKDVSDPLSGRAEVPRSERCLAAGRLPSSTGRVFPVSEKRCWSACETVLMFLLGGVSWVFCSPLKWTFPTFT